MKKRDRAHSQSLRERLCHSFDISPDIFPGGTLVEMRGRERIALRGCGCVLCYTDTQISFSCGEGVIHIKGRRLCCSSYSPRLATIDGCIDCVCFENCQ